MIKQVIKAADLFCGAGGTSSGLVQAIEALGYDIDLLAVNHWDVAISTHTTNHAGARHLCQTLDTIDPLTVVPGGRLNLLVASPECTHHSNARGGKPMSVQSRASAWMILNWLEKLYVDNVLIENVKEFRDWGPLGVNGRPLKSRKGELYQQFLANLRSLGYRVEDRILNAADYGDATTRERLFVMARRGNKQIAWPEPSHARDAVRQPHLFGVRKPWRTAREIIDWSIEGQSIFNRKKPLADNTMRRIFTGLAKYGGLPFVVPQFSEQGPRSVERPLGTITATSRGVGVAQPYLVHLRGTSTAKSVDDPIPTLTAGGNHVGVCEPFIIPVNHGNDMRNYSMDKPMPTITSVDAWAMIQPYLVKYYEGSDACSVDQPLPSVTANYEHLGLAEPFIVKFYGSSDAQPVDVPLGTVTAKDRFGLCIPQLGAVIDIKFRMLQPSELAAAMSFPKSYIFNGTREQRVKQIGNAVPVNLAKALCQSLLIKELKRVDLAA